MQLIEERRREKGPGGIRPPGAPSADPAIADKAEEKQSGRQRANGLGRESGWTAVTGAGREHLCLIHEAAQTGKRGAPPQILVSHSYAKTTATCALMSSTISSVLRVALTVAPIQSSMIADTICASAAARCAPARLFLSIMALMACSV